MYSIVAKRCLNEKLTEENKQEMAYCKYNGHVIPKGPVVTPICFKLSISKTSGDFSSNNAIVCWKAGSIVSYPSEYLFSVADNVRLIMTTVITWH